MLFLLLLLFYDDDCFFCFVVFPIFLFPSVVLFILLDFAFVGDGGVVVYAHV